MVVDGPTEAGQLAAYGAALGEGVGAGPVVGVSGEQVGFGLVVGDLLLRAQDGEAVHAAHDRLDVGAAEGPGALPAHDVGAKTGDVEDTRVGGHDGL